MTPDAFARNVELPADGLVRARFGPAQKDSFFSKTSPKKFRRAARCIVARMRSPAKGMGRIVCALPSWK